MRTDARTLRLGVIGLLLALPAVARDEGLIRTGREVYQAEGCIHCHSQYVRPGSADVGRWGPAHPLAELAAESPPLFGNRRQGPDLQNVGARRGPEWQRLHLQAPRALTPGSRMPSYAYLFRANRAGDGEALVAYLGSLGEDTLPEWWNEAARWRPRPGEAVPPGRPAQLFREYCSACHGSTGRGDGALGRQITRPPRDLARAEWLFLSRLARGEAERLALARIIKFGVRGSEMAGREYLTDAEVAALAAYVQSLRIAP
jgi:cytochrome c oxidase cbb3-type subunit 2